jgi:hypothetical protein
VVTHYIYNQYIKRYIYNVKNEKTGFKKLWVLKVLKVMLRIQTSVVMACFLLFKMKMAKMYGRNMYGHCILNINIVQLVGSEICAL